jgi:murein DD-endopeptidase MepM/ murein hydrolase activator NlpD
LYLDEDSLNFHCFPIDFNSKNFNSKAQGQSGNTYLFGGATLAAALALGIMAFAYPHIATAFWPFSPFTTPAQADSPAPVLHDSSLALLEAAVNTDPNPGKGPGSVSLTGGSALIADEGPQGVPDVDATPKSGTISQYSVRPGDTLSEIADMFGVTPNTILWGNDLKSAKDIHTGEVLTILPVSGIQHTIIKGETLASLAKKYGANADDIASFNGLDSTASLASGTTVIIPGGELAIAAPVVPTKAKTTTTSTVKSKTASIIGTIVKSGGGLINVLQNPYKGGSGAPIPGFYGNPVPGGIITQGIHGWNGVDIGAHTGTPIYAAAAGTVIVSHSSGWNGGYGSYVVIDHGNGTQTLYSHMSSVVASMDATVGKGSLIGYVGTSGEATGPHLHFEVRGAKNPFANCDVGSACSPQ